MELPVQDENIRFPLVSDCTVNVCDSAHFARVHSVWTSLIDDPIKSICGNILHCFNQNCFAYRCFIGCDYVRCCLSCQKPKLPFRDAKGFSSELHCGETRVICFQTATNLLKNTLELDCVVNLLSLCSSGRFWGRWKPLSCLKNTAAALIIWPSLSQREREVVY